MGLADTLAALIRPRRRGMFVPQSTKPIAHEALSSTMIAEGATTSIAREATRNFVRALSRDAASQLEATFAKLGPVTQPVDGEVANVVTRTTGPTIIEKLVAELKWDARNVRDAVKRALDAKPLIVDSSRTSITWDGVVLKGFAAGEYLSIDARSGDVVQLPGKLHAVKVNVNIEP